MKKRWAYALIFICIVALLIPAVLFWIRKSEKENTVTPEFVLLYAENQTEDYPTTLGGKYFAELVYQKTGGRIRILVKSGAELGSESEVIKQLRYGGIAFS